MRDHAWAVAALALLTALGFLIFPGHTWLQSDTQIYVPILERLWDPSLFNKEIIAQHPHVSFTIYDETAIFLRKITGLGFHEVLAAQQLVFRFCGLLGVYLIGLALGLGSPYSILLAACYGLGATINGPSVLTFEYEPVPRGSALGLLMLAFGLLAQGKYRWAGIAAGAATLYHVPTVYPYWAAYLVLVLLPGDKDRVRERRIALIPMVAGLAILLASSVWQGGDGQQFFLQLDPGWEAATRARASYVWVSLWNLNQPWQYVVLWLLTLLAAWRLKERVPADFRTLALIVSTIGLSSMAVSWVLLEKWKWSLMLQFQPMRALLFVMAFAILFCCAAAVTAARSGSFAEALGWLLVVFAPPVQTRTIFTLFDSSNPIYRQAAFAAASLAVVVLFALWVSTRWKAGMAGVVAIALCLPYLTPKLSKVTNYPPLHHPEMNDLTKWARENTPKDAMFLFPDAGRNLHAGIFRAEGLRALYVDWKGGGQINFIRDFLPLWQPRWRAAGEPAFDSANLDKYRGLGVDYIALYKSSPAPEAPVAYSNARYTVYRLSQ